MMARYTSADVIVVGLIGERGREVKEFIEQILGEEGLARSVVVAAPADAPPLLRMQGAAYATAIAEYFRDQGKHVLLLMDSLTRYAMAQREIALAIGEPPATKGYPPSVFAKLPALVERTGNGPEGGGSITAFYTVLTEGDDQQDPIADAARAILDGHIVLSRALAEAGHYPAIDIEASISRAMTALIDDKHLDTRAHVQADAVALSAQPRPDQRGRVFERPRPAARPRDRAVSAHGSIPAARFSRAGAIRAESRATRPAIRPRKLRNLKPMSKHLPIKTLINLAEEELDAAAKKLGKLQQERNDDRGATGCARRLSRRIPRAIHGVGARGHERRRRCAISRRSSIRSIRPSTSSATLLAAAEQRLEAAKPEWRLQKQKLGSYEVLAARGEAVLAKKSGARRAARLRRTRREDSAHAGREGLTRGRRNNSSSGSKRSSMSSVSFVSALVGATSPVVEGQAAASSRDERRLASFGMTLQGITDKANAACAGGGKAASRLLRRRRNRACTTRPSRR